MRRQIKQFRRTTSRDFPSQQDVSRQGDKGKYLRKILRLTKTKRDCTIFHRRVRNYLFLFIYLSLSLSLFFSIYERIYGRSMETMEILFNKF